MSDAINGYVTAIKNIQVNLDRMDSSMIAKEARNQTKGSIFHELKDIDT